jgi:hypothetical protein
MAASTTVTASADHTTIIGSDQPNIFSDGGHADVTLKGGAGDDLFVINNPDTVVQGGAGFDTLQLSGGINLNLANVKGIEEVDLGTNGHNSLTVSLADVLNIPDATPKTMTVLGDVSDMVKLSVADGFTHVANDTQIMNGITFDVYHAGIGSNVVNLLLQHELTVVAA